MNDEEKDGLTRRQVLAAAVAGATISALPGCEPGTAQAQSQGSNTRTNRDRMPVVYLPHGGGPWPFVNLGMFDRTEEDALAAYLRSVEHVPHVRPRAILAISAHWEEPVPTVMNGEHPPLLFDYYGFPPESYQLTWPAPGDPRLAARVQQLLGAAGFATAANAERGFDHGTFVPLKLTYPAAEIPTVQLSLKTGLDAAEHLAMGRALEPLRDEGVFIIGSGMSFHNMRALMSASPAAARPAAQAFDTWLGESVRAEPEERARRLTQWASAPAARQAHPREEHLLPLMVIAGAAGSDRGRTAYDGTLFGLKFSGYHFG